MPCPRKALFPSVRGLTFGGNVPNTIAFFLLYVGILTVIWVVALVAVWSLAAARAEPPPS